jgi:pilus assembly protein CpaE
LPEDELAAIREHTQAPVILLASGEASALLEQALEADVSDVLLLPQMTENVVFAIRKASHCRPPGRAGGRPRGPPRADRDRVLAQGRTGKTVTATNLASTFAKYEGKNTLLLDLDLQFGDAAIMLGLEPEKTIYDLVVAPGELDSEKLAGYTTRHPSGLDILPAPLRPEDAELVTEAKLARLLEVARESYDVIVVDTSPFFHGPMLATLDRTDELLLVCGLDVPTLKNVRLSLQTLELLAFPQNRIRVVLNRANSKVGMKPGEVEGALEVKVRFELPSDGKVPSPSTGAPRSSSPTTRPTSPARCVRWRRACRRSRRRRCRSDGSSAGHSHGTPRSPQGRQRERHGLQPRRDHGSPHGASGRGCAARARGADPYAELKTRVHHACIAKLGPELFTAETTGDLSERVLRAVTEQLALDRTPLTRDERRQLVREITDDILGYGPLEPFLRDDSVTEVMVNGGERIYIERSARSS